MNLILGIENYIQKEISGITNLNDIEDLEKYLTTKSELVQNADGDLETLDATMTKKKFKDTILKEYKKYKKQVLSELKNGKSR